MIFVGVISVLCLAHGALSRCMCNGSQCGRTVSLDAANPTVVVQNARENDLHLATDKCFAKFRIEPGTQVRNVDANLIGRSLRIVWTKCTQNGRKFPKLPVCNIHWDFVPQNKKGLTIPHWPATNHYSF